MYNLLTINGFKENQKHLYNLPMMIIYHHNNRLYRKDVNKSILLIKIFIKIINEL